MFLKQDILYAGAVKNLDLEAFSLLWNKPLTSPKQWFCIIYVYNETLIPLQSVFVIRGNYHCNNIFSVFVVEECVQNKLSLSIASTTVYLTHTTHWASLSTWVDSVEIKCQSDSTEFFIADLIACSPCFGNQ